MELAVLGLVGLILFFLSIYLYHRWILKREGALFTQRDVRFVRRISSRFTGAVVIILSYLIAALAETWIVYLFGKWILHDPYWVERIDVPLGHAVWFLELFLFLALFLAFYYLMWRYYAKLIVTDDKLIALGNRVLTIDKDQIADIEVVPAKERKWRQTLGTMLRFYKPVVKLTLKDGSAFYLRSANAEHLKEDLEKWLR
jgi:hypothetical protein